MNKALKVVLIIIGSFVGFFVVILGIGLWATSGIAGVAGDQLALISQGKVEEAYNQYGSKDFKAATTLEDFKSFVESHKALAENVDVSFPSREISNDVGTLEAKLEGKDGSTTNVNYTLVKEGEEWKVLNMEFPKAGLMNNWESVTTSLISGIAMADTADEDGAVELSANMSVFKSETAVIYATVYLANSPANLAVTSWLQYPKTGDELGPVSYVTKESGDQVVMFTFSKPTAGWMLGDYIFKVNVGAGEEKIVNFKVE